MTETTVRWQEGSEFARPDFWNRTARGLLFRVLREIRHGQVILHDAEGRFVFGDPASGLRSSLWVADPAAYTRMLLEGSVGAGRAYADGAWDSDDLVGFIRILARNGKAMARSRSGWGRVMDVSGRMHRWRRRNSLKGSKENISAHYDLGNEFFGTFLDPTMMYSAAFFDSETTSLEQASVAKLDRICRKLDLGPEDHLLEIGTGWGGLAVHAAREYGCRVTTTTISREQHAFATERVREQGLEDRVTVLDKDYRELSGTYDKLVSVEMIEAVGPEYLDGFFSLCSGLLRPEGLMLVQAITIDDREYERAARSVDFIKHFIFPGSCIPSVERMVRAVAGHTDMQVHDLEDLTPHYALTLARWRERFGARAETLERLGFDRRFRRLWEFYFAYCEGGFRERRIGDVHLLLAKPAYRSGLGGGSRSVREAGDVAG